MSTKLRVGKVEMLQIPGTKRARWRWVVRQLPSGRYMARTPKLHVQIKKLHLKRNSDFNAEHMLPKGTRRRQHRMLKNNRCSGQERGQ